LETGASRSARADASSRQSLPASPFAGFSPDQVEGSIVERFERQVELHPDRSALKAEPDVLSYIELDRLANRIAHAILSNSPRQGGQVALLSDRQTTLVAASLGTLKAARAYVTLDPDAPLARQEYILRDAEVSVIVTDSALLQRAERMASGRVVLDLHALEADLSDACPKLTIGPDSLAYLVYTSGSTGQPKGVMESHRNVLHFTMSLTNACRISPDDRLTLLVPFSFSAAATPTFGALLNGATLHPLNLRAQGLGQLAGWLLRERITFLHTVPSVFRTFLQRLDPDTRFPDIRLIYMGAERLYADDLRLYRRHFSDDCLLLHHYGASEKKVICRYAISRQTEVYGSVVPVGFPVEDTEVELVDELGRRVPPGEVGEIRVRSRFVSPGYWRKPELSARTFQRDPSESEVRIFHTGDRGRIDPRGRLHLLGRSDHQVKVRGQRVELGEVEAALLELPGVSEAVVVARDAEGNRTVLAAYVVPEAGLACTTASIRTALRARLSEYMLPSIFITLDRMPRNLNGKIDRLSLPEPISVRPSLETTYVAPRSAEERRLAEIWGQALDVRPVGVRDRFTDLGGDSLAAEAVFAAIEAGFGRSLPASLLIQCPTIEALARAIAKLDTAGAEAVLVPLRPAGRLTPLFCVHPLGGDVLEFTHLALHLGPDQPVFGLRAPEPAERTEIFTTQERLANFYVGAIRAAQPAGPYRLLGYSYGAGLALEMAQQLLDGGQDVDLLAIIDSAPPGSKYKKLVWTPAYFLRMGSRLPGLLRALRELSAQQRRAYLYLEMQMLKAMCRNSLQRRLTRLGASVRRSLAPEPAPDFGLVPRHLSARERRIARELLRLRALYRPRPYAGSVTVFRARAQPLVTSGDPALEWRAVVSGPLESVDVPGAHDCVLQEPHVRQLARELELRTAASSQIEAGRSRPSNSVRSSAAPL
jgi:amino acid adenylation domain-containing protein